MKALKVLDAVRIRSKDAGCTHTGGLRGEMGLDSPFSEGRLTQSKARFQKLTWHLFCRTKPLEHGYCFPLLPTEAARRGFVTHQVVPTPQRSTHWLRQDAKASLVRSPDAGWTEALNYVTSDHEDPGETPLSCPTFLHFPAFVWRHSQLAWLFAI